MTVSETETPTARAADEVRPPASVSHGIRLRADAVSLGYDARTVVDGVTLDVPTGQVTVVVGPNGCGKSTLLRGLGRLLKPRGGSVLLDGEEIGSLPTREVARRLGLLPQQPIVPEGVSVLELVERGRHPHHGLFRTWGRADEEAVASALVRTDLVHLAAVPVDSLSGGQRQRVWLAMVLAQATPVLLLDEPTSFLDIAHQLDVLDLVRSLCDDSGTTVVMVLHDLAMAARYADHLVAMRDGRIVAEGSPAEVVTPEVIAEVFGVTASVLIDPESGTPVVIPRRRQS
jgi:iron complex transport system ATP-binding protein